MLWLLLKKHYNDNDELDNFINFYNITLRIILIV